MTISSNCPQRFNQVAIISNALLLFCLITFNLLNPSGFAAQLRRDGGPGGAGAFENLTYIVLIPAILFGGYAFYQCRRQKQCPYMSYWLLAWTLCCVYFAGEEVSWGQWYFHWGTPDILMAVNKQHETNLHNISPWLNRIPRTAIELLIMWGGTAVPLRRLLADKYPRLKLRCLSNWRGLLYAPTALFLAGLVFTLARIMDWVIDRFPEAPLVYRNFGHSELRDFAIAWFLMWYLFSYAARLRSTKGSAVTDTQGDSQFCARCGLRNVC